MHEWQAKTPSASSAAQEAKTEAKEDLPPASTPAPASRPSTRDASSRSSSALGRRSALGFRAPPPPPSAAEQLYGQVAAPKVSRHVSILSPRTRKLIAHAAQEEFDGDDDDDDDSPASDLPGSIKYYESKERYARDAARKRRAANPRPTQPPPQVAPLAASFTRLTRALSNASLDPRGGDASTISSSRSELHGSASAASTFGLGGSSDAGSSSARLARQTRLAKRKQVFGTIAREMRLERDAELRHLEATSHRSATGRKAISEWPKLRQRFLASPHPQHHFGGGELGVEVGLAVANLWDGRQAVA